MAVVDASVALKWVLTEDESDRAVALLRSELLIAPDFLLLECANVLALQVRRRLLTSQQAEANFAHLSALGIRLVRSAPHVREAQRIAVALQQTAYDSLYLAVALAERAELVTADARFAVVAQAGGYKDVVRRL